MNMEHSYEELLYHIILPRTLPDAKSENHEKRDLNFLSLMSETIQNLSEKIPSPTVRMFASLNRIYDNRTKETISQEINELKPGEIFAMFVRRQNCGLMIYMPPIDENGCQSTNVIVSTFPGNLHPVEIYKYPSDLQV